MKNIIKIRAILSLLLLISFIVVFLTGLGLFFSKNEMFIINEWPLEKIHTLSSFIMSALILIHFGINKKMMINEVKTLLKR